jgi:hypothetical protein
MQLEPNDLHGVFTNDQNNLVFTNAQGSRVLSCAARNRTTGGPGFGHNGRCPLGEFLLGSPVAMNKVPFGHWFTPILDYQNNHAMRNFGREGIGIHGGGSGLPNPFAPQQGWMVTHGCIRVQNADNATLVPFVQQAHQRGGRVYLTVRNDGPATADDFQALAIVVNGTPVADAGGFVNDVGRSWGWVRPIAAAAGIAIVGVGDDSVQLARGGTTITIGGDDYELRAPGQGFVWLRQLSGLPGIAVAFDQPANAVEITAS